MTRAERIERIMSEAMTQDRVIVFDSESRRGSAHLERYYAHAVAVVDYVNTRLAVEYQQSQQARDVAAALAARDEKPGPLLAAASSSSWDGKPGPV